MRTRGLPTALVRPGVQEAASQTNIQVHGGLSLFQEPTGCHCLGSVPEGQVTLDGRGGLERQSLGQRRREEGRLARGLHGGQVSLPVVTLKHRVPTVHHPK